jgi:hypothetical protein
LLAKFLGTHATRAARVTTMQAPAAPAMRAKIKFKSDNVPADGTSAAGG